MGPFWWLLVFGPAIRQWILLVLSYHRIQGENHGEKAHKRDWGLSGNLEETDVTIIILVVHIIIFMSAVSFN